MSVHKNIFHTSDFVTYTVIFICLILEFFIPTNLGIDRKVELTVGVFILICAWTIIFTTKHQFRKENQKTSPGNETVTIIKNSIFKYSRNPIYLGMAMIPLASGFLFDSIWLSIGTLPTIFLMQKLLIQPEEKYLLEKFGDEYLEYCKKVKRWF